MRAAHEAGEMREGVAARESSVLSLGFRRRREEAVLPRARAPQLPGTQSTNAAEYDFRDFHSSKRRNLYSPRPCPRAPWTPREARARSALSRHLSQLGPASRALLLSQAGPHAARAFTATNSATIARPAPPPAFFASRAPPLEHAVARVCREAGVRVGDMNIDVPVSDARRIEVVANGLPPWHGAQLAIDAAIVSPVTRTGSARPGADTRPAAAVQDAARRKRRQTYPELQSARRARLVVLGIEVGGRFSTEAASFLRFLAQH